MSWFTDALPVVGGMLAHWIGDEIHKRAERNSLAKKLDDGQKTAREIAEQVIIAQRFRDMDATVKQIDAQRAQSRIDEQAAIERGKENANLVTIVKSTKKEKP